MSVSLVLRRGATLLIPCLIYLFFLGEENHKLPLYFSLTGMAVTAWMLNVFPAIGVAALLTFAYMLAGLAGPEVVFKPWTTVLPWLSFAAIILGIAMEKPIWRNGLLFGVYGFRAEVLTGWLLALFWEGFCWLPFFRPYWQEW